MTFSSIFPPTPSCWHITYLRADYILPTVLPSVVGTAGESPKYSEPYRLYNLDVFEYELDETMALYGEKLSTQY